MFKTHSVIRGILFIKGSLETETFENRLGQYIRPWGSQARQHLIPAVPEMGSKEKMALSIIKWLSIAGVIGRQNP